MRLWGWMLGLGTRGTGFSGENGKCVSCAQGGPCGGAHQPQGAVAAARMRLAVVGTWKNGVGPSPSPAWIWAEPALGEPNLGTGQSDGSHSALDETEGPNATSAFAVQPHALPMLSRPLQMSLVSLILALTLVSNACLIGNIGRNGLKLRTVNFLLIQSLCVADWLGAALVLPVPLAAMAHGAWTFGPQMCTAASVITVALWGQHLLLLVMLKADRLMAACLPIGKYPLVSTQGILIAVGATWLISFSCAGLATGCFGAVFEPAVALCIPDLPFAAFLVLLTIYCTCLFVVTSAYISVALTLGRRKRNTKRLDRTDQIGACAEYGRLQKSALTSFLLSLAHLLLYVPAMLVVGLRGKALPPVAILICDLLVYCEFLVHPVLLLLTSAKLRDEVSRALRRIVCPLG